MLPRWALGNWWSRYWPYTDEELRTLITDFEEHSIPLSVCIIDMDWHITDTGNKSSGWTGYTWNRELFPDPEATIAFIHDHGLKTALNLHPAEGIHPHEAQYSEFAGRIGIDPEREKPVRFDLADPKFARAYFELLHHPEEARGVDFWWIDWQQGTLSGMPGLDPLFWLNHLHFYDLARPQDVGQHSGGGSDQGKSASEETSQPAKQPNKRPFIFSRWGGLGNHRYPIGFSGDTIITWDSLAFQPYFTSTAANVGYGWWSHDIGGHYGGSPSPELYARWVQYGVFSPILRLHSTRNPLLERRPFGWDAETERVASQAMRLRHRLIPYIYSMAWRDHHEAEAMIRPMYHDHPEERAAYFCPDQYTFGPALIAAPFVSPRSEDTGLSRQVVWLPEGGWNLFSGERLEPGWHAVYGDLDDIPVYAKPGAILPLCEPDDWRDPAALEVHIFPGASNKFELYEDDGESTAYLDGEYNLTRFDVDWTENGLTFGLQPSTNSRTYTLRFRGITAPDSFEARLNGQLVPVASEYDAKEHTLVISPPDIGAGEAFNLVLMGAGIHEPDEVDEIAALRKMVRAFNADNTSKQVLIDAVPRIVEDPAWLAAYRVSFTEAQLRAIMECVVGAGIHEINHTLERQVIAWNRDGRAEASYQVSAEHHRRWLSSERYSLENERVPVFRGWKPVEDFNDAYWKLTFRWGDVTTVELTGR
jgi:alpha-glucosidase (family GH31 glycosyl hydrolase)